MAQYRGDNARNLEWWTPGQILDKFTSNSVAASDYFRENRVGIRGIALRVGNNRYGGDRAVVVMDTRTNTELQVWFDGSQRRQVGTIRPNTEIYLTAVFEEEGYRTIKFTGGDFPWPVE